MTIVDLNDLPSHIDLVSGDVLVLSADASSASIQVEVSSSHFHASKNVVMPNSERILFRGEAESSGFGTIVIHTTERNSGAAPEKKRLMYTIRSERN